MVNKRWNYNPKRLLNNRFMDLSIREIEHLLHYKKAFMNPKCRTLLKKYLRKNLVKKSLFVKIIKITQL